MGGCCGSASKSELRQPLAGGDKRRRRAVAVDGASYTVDQQLGEGTYAVVYLCTAPDGARVAVKESLLDPDVHANALQEVDLLRGLHHPNIVELLNSQVTRMPSGKYEVRLVMERCGSSLVQQMADRQTAGQRFAEAEIVEVMWCVGSALAYLHSRSPPIAHRDLKAENVLSAAGAGAGAGARWKLCDFGSATTFAYECKTSADITRAKEEMERNTTMCYNAPEMLDLWTKQRVDEKVDVWALGVLLYYLMFLALPFEDNMLQITQCKYTVPSEDGHSPGLVALLRQLLTASPAKRPDAWAVLDALRALQPSLPPPPPAPTPKPVQPTRP